MGTLAGDRRDYHHTIVRRALLALLLVLLLAAPAQAVVPPAPAAPTIDVIVELEPASLAQRGLSATDEGRRSRAALAAVDRAQATFERRLAHALPTAEVSWRYRIVLDAVALSIRASSLAGLERLPGVRSVYPSVRYHTLLDSSPAQIGAPAAWSGGLDGKGIRIGIIDDGIDQSHPFFSAAGFVAPDGFPKGNRAFTTARVIVARSFPPPGATWRYAARPFDPRYSGHATHVAGIAAGGPSSTPLGQLSGIAPAAYLGNYKALTIPTDSGLGLDGNSPEIVAAIEAAVADGMDVLNLSIGEPQVTPEHDAVARALDNATAAGVVVVVAAGNEHSDLGAGSIGSPGSTASAITVAAADTGPVIAPFSSAGPTTLGLLAKPDVTAPGVSIASAVPGGWAALSGTSMATPHVSGVAALLLQAHSGWLPAEVKSALVVTSRPVSRGSPGSGEVPPSRQGGGLVDAEAALEPLLFASPQSLGFGLLDVAAGTVSESAEITLADAGGGAGTWSVSIEHAEAGPGLTVSAPAAVEVPGVLAVDVTADAAAPEGERSGFVVLRREGASRRIPFWLRVTRPLLGTEPSETLTRPGTYARDLRDGLSLVERYRYPERAAFLPSSLPGPEQVFRVVVPPGVANVGVAVVSQARGVAIEPRIVIGAEENRLAGVPALPLVTNPYLDRFGSMVRSSAALLPRAGEHSLVFDSTGPGRAGPYRFRLWIDDTSPPSARLLSTTVSAGRLLVRVGDAGAGVDPQGIRFRLDGGAWRRGTLSKDGRTATLRVAGARPGRHLLTVRVADRQEAKNDENVASILPNTRELRTTIRVR
ncbi:MAG: S8 family serine peptidase [Gaiellales bacterium]